MSFEIVSKLVLCLLAVPVVLWLDRAGARDSRRQAGSILVLVATIAVGAYYNYGAFHGTSYIHHWEQFHYYLGSKYFPELGYDGLYAASLRAQRETHREMNFQAWTRDLTTNEVTSSWQVLARGTEVKERFSEERWRSFLADHTYFLERNNWQYMRRIRMDHGYNPTPTWTAVARLFDAWLPADDGSLSWLGSLDLVLLVVLFAFIITTYGSRIGCFSLIVFGLGYPWRFDWVGGALLRLDWLVAVGVAVCLLRRERYRWAGALLAYAGLVRIFPLALLLGPGVLALRALIKKEDFGWAWRFAQGFLLSLVLCVLAGSLAGRGVEAWGEFASNLETHEETWLTNNVGLKNVLLYDVDTMQRNRVNWSLPEPWLPWQRHMTQVKEERAAWFYALAGLYLLLVAAAAWRAQRDESVILGIGAVFALGLLTCYYWSMLLLVPLRDGRKGAATLLLLSAGLYGLHLATPPSFEMIYGLMSWAMALLLLVWLGPQAWANFRAASDSGRASPEA